MQILAALKWINRHSASSVLLLLLLSASTFAHVLARVRMDMASRQFAIMDDRTIRQMGLIDFMHAHYWVAIAYAAVYLGSLLWLEIRGAPRWAVWVTFGLLALPCLVYAGACLRIGNKFILWTT
jgi:hypothetical protein